MDSARSGRQAVEIARADYNRADRPNFELSRDAQRADIFVVAVRMLTGPLIEPATWTFVLRNEVVSLR